MTAGKGTRLGRMSNYINKSLAPVAYQPVISRIIAKFPRDTHYVIAVGYLESLVRDFVGIAAGLPVGDIGLILSVSSAIDMTLFAPAGFAMDRLGRKWASLPCVLIMSAGLALVPFAGSFVALMLAGIVVGFGNGLGSGAMLTLGADLAPEENRAEFLGVWRLISDSGGAMGPAVIGQIGQAAALTVAGIATAGVGVAGAAVLIFLVPETLARRPRRARRR